MPRQARQASETGIYHVMMRGINHQNIFEEQEDYYQFLNTLDLMAQSYESDGTPAGRNYILYAYCLMSNHIHLLIREREDTIGMAIKRIASSYVYYCMTVIQLFKIWVYMRYKIPQKRASRQYSKREFLQQYS